MPFQRKAKYAPPEKQFLDAIKANDFDEMQMVMNTHKGKLDLNTTEGYGMSGLMYAADRGYWRISEHLVTKTNKAVKLDMQDDYGQSALMYAAFTGHWNICQLLMLNGANVNLKTDNNQNALMKAVYGSCGSEMVQLFLHFKSELDLQSEPHKLSALMIACMNNNLGAVQVLRRAECKVESVDKDGNTALLLSAKGSWSVMEYLIKWGANTEHKNNAGQDIHHLATNEALKAKLEEVVGKGIKARANRRMSVAAMAGFSLASYQKMISTAPNRKQSIAMNAEQVAEMEKEVAAAQAQEEKKA